MKKFKKSTIARLKETRWQVNENFKNFHCLKVIAYIQNFPSNGLFVAENTGEIWRKSSYFKYIRVLSVGNNFQIFPNLYKEEMLHHHHHLHLYFLSPPCASNYIKQFTCITLGRRGKAASSCISLITFFEKQKENQKEGILKQDNMRI